MENHDIENCAKNNNIDVSLITDQPLVGLRDLAIMAAGWGVITAGLVFLQLTTGHVIHL